MYKPLNERSTLRQVYVNGMSHCTFKHRVPFEKVFTFAIGGEVTMQLICFIEVSILFSPSNFIDFFSKLHQITFLYFCFH